MSVLCPGRDSDTLAVGAALLGDGGRLRKDLQPSRMADDERK